MDAIRKKYEELLGFVPANLEKRIVLAEKAQRQKTIEVVENSREHFIHKNALDAKTQQLIHFALLIGAMHEKPAKLHAKAAVKAGATLEELFGVCETAIITGGMPSFSLAVDCVFEAFNPEV